MIAEQRMDVIIKAGDFNASMKAGIELSLMSNVSTSMVILYSLPPDSKEYIEDFFENAIGLDLSSLLPRMRRNLFT
jgi:hypothetical protein